MTSSPSLTEKVAEPSALWRNAIPLLTFLLAAVYGVAFVHRGWIPFDEGMLGQAADRVLHGELPHRDFDDTYTGGLSYLHALAFQLLGERLSSPRWVLYGFFLLTVPVLYGLARRVAVPWVAALVTLLAVVLSLPNYFAAMPSWYHLFGSVFGTWALLRYLDSNHSRWLLLAGVCGGLITIIKISGLSYLSAALLFLVYHEQQSWQRKHAPTGGAGTGSWAFGGFKLLALTLFLVLHRTFIGTVNSGMDLLFFVLPDAALSLIILAGEWQLGPTPFWPRLKRLVKLIGPVLLSFSMVVSVLVVFYSLQGALADLYRGVLVLPGLRKDFAQEPLPSLGMMLLCVPWIFFLLAVGQPSLRIWMRPLLPMLIALLAVIVGWVYSQFVYHAYQTQRVETLAAAFDLANAHFLYQYVFAILRHTTPVLMLFGGVYLFVKSAPAEAFPNAALDGIPGKRREELFLLLAMAAQMALLQYPFALPMYFLYGSPLVVLAWLYAMESQPAAPRRLHLVVLIFYFFYAVIWLNTTRTGHTGVIYERADLVPLSLRRADLEVQRGNVVEYQELIAAIQAIVKPGEPIWASPDCPEVYFLSETRNPTRTLFDFFEEGERDRTERIVTMLQRLQVRVVVINEEPRFSPKIDPEFQGAIERNWPEQRRIGDFTLRWQKN